MPQLDPAPWLAIFTYTWFVLTTIVPPKVLAHTFPAEPTVRSAEATKTEPWSWLSP
uniref:ATP synthase F0 subunit 8 n=1 Tax=Parupeneus barberinoides TaxID=586843 RepID=UPI002799D962|nr:ATP synthase F0 subunit 8 [Parupeneus barberinoides]WGO62564.1 ATP synthase F0 subunit 8 [Parupeneus barberinoides]